MEEEGILNQREIHRFASLTVEARAVWLKRGARSREIAKSNVQTSFVIHMIHPYTHCVATGGLGMHD